MTAEEIREIAIDSATIYNEFLEANGKGIQEIDVFEFSYLESKGLLMKLRLSAKLFDTESIFFELLTNGEKYDTSVIKIVEYDSDKNILLIKPTEPVAPFFKNLRSGDLKVISDLKFLVQRVKSWYENNGSKLQLPKKKSILENKFNEIEYFSEKQFFPSENQKKSIQSIFQEPFSYIWGAPGTGKTQFVLAYAVLHYIKNSYKIAILAPTNNSIEQVLRGVIKMTDKAGINRNQIIRLGTPSRKFAEEFPEVCEEKGVQKNLSEMDKQINIIERMIYYENSCNQLKEFESKISLFTNLEKLETQFKTASQNLELEKNKCKRKEIDLKFVDDEILKIKKGQEFEIKKLNSFVNKLTKFFSSKPSRHENTLTMLDAQLITKLKEKEFFKYEFDEVCKTVSKVNSKVNEISFATENHIHTIKQAFNIHKKFVEIINSLTEENWKEKKLSLLAKISEESELREVDSHLVADYQPIPIDQLKKELKNYLIIRNKLALSSTEEKLKSVKVIACTLDGYINRFEEKNLNVEHIFIDEAGYANIIKVMTLFNNNSPISLLGDHMQLPPVCEINDSNIQNEEKYKNMFLWAQSGIFIEKLFDSTRDMALNQYLNNAPFQTNILKKTSLNSTYRFGENLAKILGHHVYQGDFTSANLAGETQILFINAKKDEPLRSRTSINEIKKIKELINELKRLGKTDYVILTPYSKQIKLLNNHLSQDNGSSVF